MIALLAAEILEAIVGAELAWRKRTLEALRRVDPICCAGQAELALDRAAELGFSEVVIMDDPAGRGVVIAARHACGRAERRVAWASAIAGSAAPALLVAGVIGALRCRRCHHSDVHPARW